MSTRKSTTSTARTARTVYTSPEGRVVVTRTEDADYNLSIDDQPAGVYTNAHAAEQAGLVELEYRVKQERWLAADEAAADEADEAARNFSDEADEAYQQAYRSGAQAMDASMDMTCYCELCGADVMPDEAALVGERLACGWCAGKAQGIARFVARHGHAPGEPTPAAPSLVDAFTMSDQAWSAAIARYAPTPRRSFIAHELPAFVEELRGLLAYLPDGGVWQSANGDIRLVQAPTRYAAALAREVK